MKIGIEEARRLIAENQQAQDPFLDLGNLGLTELPEELWELAHLKRLNLGVGYKNKDGNWQDIWKGSLRQSFSVV
jgi:hypothetical protein